MPNFAPGLVSRRIWISASHFTYLEFLIWLCAVILQKSNVLILADFISLLGLLESNNSLPLSKYCGLEQCILHCFVLIYFLCLYLIKKKKVTITTWCLQLLLFTKHFWCRRKGLKWNLKQKQQQKNQPASNLSVAFILNVL